MSDHCSPSPSIVVGIDGSRSAVDAALWAIDEAVSRDIPLRLVYAMNSTDTVPETAARDLARAQAAVQFARTVVESTDKPVKVEAEILQDRPMRALLEASRWAAMICVGAMGLRHCVQGRMGSTAAALASAAHCPVAIVRGHDRLQADDQSVVVEIDRSPASEGVLRRAIDEARLRGVSLRVLTMWQSSSTDIHDGRAVADGLRRASAHLDRRLAQWSKRFPDLDMRAVAIQDGTVNFLTENARSVQLLVVGRERAHGIGALVGPPGYAALHGASCSVLICEPQNIL